jgi:hypothetical protein
MARLLIDTADRNADFALLQHALRWLYTGIYVDGAPGPEQSQKPGQPPQ